MASVCPVTIGDPAVGMTALAYNLYTDFATQAVNTAQAAVAGLQSIQLDPIVFNVSFADVQLGTYTIPPRPADPPIVYLDVGDPGAPPVASITMPTFDNAPTDSTQVPVIPVRLDPSPALPAAVGPAPTLATIVIPGAPAFPVFPGMLPITVPAPLVLPAFQGTRPTFLGAVPNNNFAFTPQQYSSSLLTQLGTTVSTMLGGDTGLPPSVIAALRARAYAAIDIQETRAVQQAFEDFSALGYTEPNGILVRRVDEVHQNNQNQRNSVVRDLYIQDEQEKLKSLRDAVANGVALESAKMQAFTEYMKLSLDAAKTIVQFGIDLLNAQISIFNAEQQAYATDATVFRELVNAAVAGYQGQIEGQKLIVQINQVDAEIYDTQVRSLVAIFNAEIEGARAQALNNQQLLDVFRAQIENATEQVREYEAVYNGFTALVNSDIARAKLYETAENAFATRVSAWGKVQDTKVAEAQLGVSLSELNLRGWHGLLDKFTAKSQAERDRVSSEVQAFVGNVELYKADASIQQVASAVQQRNTELAIERERARVDTALKQADLQINQLEKLIALLLEKVKTIATTETQLAASAMSAMSFHAGVTSSRAENQACQTIFEFIGSAT